MTITLELTPGMEVALTEAAARQASGRQWPGDETDAELQAALKAMG